MVTVQRQELACRLFAVEIEGSSLTAAELITKVAADLNQAVPSEVTAVEGISGVPGKLAIGDEMWCVYQVPGMVRYEWCTGPAPRGIGQDPKTAGA